MNQIVKANLGFSGSSMRNLTNEEITLISGGNPALVVAAGVAASFGALSAAEGFGEKIGKALYYFLNK